MLISGLLLAAQFSLPIVTGAREHDVRSVFSVDDFPAYVQRAGIDRFVSTKTTVRADGTTQDCIVEGGSGDPKLDAYTCAIILRRARFQPAKWIDGSATYGVVRVPVSWVIGGPASKSEQEKAFPVDMDLTVTRLPKGAGRLTDLRLMIAVHESGRVAACGGPPDLMDNENTKKFPELVPIACEHLLKEFTAIPAKDATGKPMRSVQTAFVRFSVSP
jgi:TonB family protein